MSRKRKPEQFEIIDGNAAPVLAVDTETAARMLGIKAGTLENWRYGKGAFRGPKYARVGGRIVYPVDELKCYLDECIVR